MQLQTITQIRPLSTTLSKEAPKVDYEKFKEIIKEDQKADLIEGEIIMQSPASYKHEDLFMKLAVIMRAYVNKKDLGKVLGSRSLVRIDEQSGYEPDILFVSKDRLSIIKNIDIIEGPDVVVEIISKTSRIYDRVDKFLGYQKAGVKEYWLIDIEEGIAEFYENIDGRFVQIDVEEGVFKSRAIKGFWLKLEWLFSDVDEFAVLEEILSKNNEQS